MPHMKSSLETGYSEPTEVKKSHDPVVKPDEKVITTYTFCRDRKKYFSACKRAIIQLRRPAA